MCSSYINFLTADPEATSSRSKSPDDKCWNLVYMIKLDLIGIVIVYMLIMYKIRLYLTHNVGWDVHIEFPFQSQDLQEPKWWELSCFSMRPYRREPFFLDYTSFGLLQRYNFVKFTVNLEYKSKNLLTSHLSQV